MPVISYNTRAAAQGKNGDRPGSQKAGKEQQRRRPQPRPLSRRTKQNQEATSLQIDKDVDMEGTGKEDGICQTTAAGNSAEPDSDEGDPDTQRGRKRKDAESLERPAKKPNSAPHPSTNHNSSIPHSLSGTTEGWREKVSPAFGLDSTSNQDGPSPTAHPDSENPKGVFVRERSMEEDVDSSGEQMDEAAPINLDLRKLASKSKSKKGKSSHVTSPTGFSRPDPLGHGLQVIGGHAESLRDQGRNESINENKEHHDLHQGHQENNEGDSEEHHDPYEGRKERKKPQQCQSISEESGEDPMPFPPSQPRRASNHRQSTQDSQEDPMPFPPSQPRRASNHRQSTQDSQEDPMPIPPSQPRRASNHRQSTQDSQEDPMPFPPSQPRRASNHRQSTQDSQEDPMPFPPSQPRRASNHHQSTQDSQEDFLPSQPRRASNHRQSTQDSQEDQEVPMVRRHSNGRAAKGLLRNQRNQNGGKGTRILQARNVQGVNGSQAVVTSRSMRHFTLRDLPMVDRADLERWHSLMVPQWIDFVFSAVEDPWRPGDVVQAAQTIWDASFADSELEKYPLAQKGEPVFFLLRQRIYEFRNHLAERAEIAVEDFFDSNTLESVKDKADYVAWAVPEDTVTYDRRGRSISTPPEFFPFLWEFAGDDGNPEDGAVGPFRHECILNTFAQFLEATDHLPTNIILLENGHPPRGALALATAAVERAFTQWREGIYKPLPATLSTFNRNLWGPKTAEYMQSLDHADDDFWTNVIDKAQPYKGRYKAEDQYLKNFVDSRINGSSGRAKVFIQ